MTYKQSESETPLYFAFHIHMHSSLHNVEDSNLDLEYCSEVTVLNDPQCLRHLDPENQVMGVKQMMTKAVKAAKGCVGEGGSKEMKKFLKGVHKKIGDVLLEEKDKVISAHLLLSNTSEGVVEIVTLQINTIRSKFGNDT